MEKIKNLSGNRPPSSVPGIMGTPKQETAGLAAIGDQAEDQARIVNERILDGNREGAINQHTVSLMCGFRRVLGRDGLRERTDEITLELATLDGLVRVTMTKV